MNSVFYRRRLTRSPAFKPANLGPAFNPRGHVQLAIGHFQKNHNGSTGSVLIKVIKGIIKGARLELIYKSA